MRNVIVTVACAAALAACDGRRGSGGGPDGGGAHDASPTDAPPGDAPHGDTGTPDAGACATVGMASGNVLTNEPSVGYVNMGPSTLTLVTSNFIVPYPGVDSLYWVGEIHNTGTTVVCPDVRIDVASTSPASTSFYGNQDSLSGSTSTNSCIDPGQYGIGYEVYSSYTLADLRAKGTLHYEVHDFVLPEMPDPARPTVTITGTMLDTAAGWYVANGSLHAASVGDIYNVSVDIFPRDPCGLLGDKIDYIDLGTISASSTTTFTTTIGAPYDFSDQRIVVDYLRR